MGVNCNPLGKLSIKKLAKYKIREDKIQKSTPLEWFTIYKNCKPNNINCGDNNLTSLLRLNPLNPFHF